MKKTFYFLFALCFLSLGVMAQEVVILADFEDGTNQGITAWTGHAYEIVANPDPDEVNDSNYSLYYMGSHGWGAINKWVGAGNIFQPEYSRFTIDVYVPEGHIDAHGNPDGTITFQFIAGGSISGAPNHNIPITMNVEEAWYTIEFNIGGLPAHDYRQISIQYQGLNFYADNLRFIIDEPVVNPVWADFEDGTYQGFNDTGWGTDCDTQVVDNPDPDDLNPSSKVLHWFDVNPWGGPWRWDPGVFHADLLAVHIDIYVPETAEGNRLFRIIGQNSPSGAPNFESEWLEVTEDNAWTKLQFDMSELDNYDYNIFFFITQTDGFYADNFQSITEEEPELYTLTLVADPAEGGTVSGGGEYAAGAMVPVSAEAAEGYQFVNWTTGGGADGFEVAGAGTVAANGIYVEDGEVNGKPKYVMGAFEIYFQAPGWLLVDKTVGEEFLYYIESDASTPPQDGWLVFNGIAPAPTLTPAQGGTVVSEDASFTYEMPAENVTLTANFETATDPTFYTLTLIANPEEAATPIGAGEYEAGESIFIQIIVNDGYQFVNWDKDGEHYTWFMNFSYTMPAADVTMTANLNAVYSLELLVNPEGAGSVTGAGNYAEGASVSISAVANPGFTFVNWTGEDDAIVSEVPDFTYTMPALATTFTANFEEAEPVVINEFPWLEDFELPAFPPEGWAVANIEGDETWTRNFAPGGGHSAFHVYGYWQENTWLITPALELAEGMEYELSFRSYNEYADYYPGAGANSVQVSTGSPNPDSGDFEMIWTTASVIEAWEDTFIDLSEYAGQTIYIAFRYFAEYTHSWHVDDVLVTETEQEPEYFTVTFDLTDNNGNNIEDALITFAGIENEPGDYVFHIMEEGSYDYFIDAFCYLIEEGTLFVDEDMFVELTLGHLPGDADGNGAVNVLDVIAMGNYYTGNIPANFCIINADVNGDGDINILDIIAVINIFGSGKISPYVGLNSDAANLFIGEDGISIESDGTVAGLQFVVAGYTLQQINIKLELNGYEMISFVDGDKLHAMIFSLDNKAFAPGLQKLVSFSEPVKNAEWVEVIAGNVNADNVPVNLHSDEATGLAGLHGQAEINMYPNPASGHVNIASDNEMTLVRIINSGGSIVKSIDARTTNVEINIGDLPSGIYIIQVSTESEIITKRLNVVK